MMANLRERFEVCCKGGILLVAFLFDDWLYMNDNVSSWEKQYTYSRQINTYSPICFFTHALWARSCGTITIHVQKKKKKERKEKTKPYTRHQSHVVAVAINRKVKMSEKLTKLSWIFLITDWIDLITDWIDLITDWIDIIIDKTIKKWLKSMCDGPTDRPTDRLTVRPA